MANYFRHLEAREMSLSGVLYSVSAYFTVTGNETKYMQIKTGAESCMIIDYRVSSSAEPLQIQAIESPTLTNGTTALTAFKLNRQKSGSPTTLFYSDPTGISGGTVIHNEICTAGKGAGAQADDAGTWVLKKSTSYLWKLVQLTNQATLIAVELTFAEDYPSAG